MRRLVSSALLCLGVLWLPSAGAAQVDDRSTLIAFLEDNLSDAGRKVTITGFEGALSSTAKLREMTIADDDGIWITLRDVSLNWDRTALLSGEVLVNELTAAEIIVDRIPATGTGNGTPATEGAAFSLPELPVSIRIGRIAAQSIVLGDSILGETVEGAAEASVSLVGGAGSIVINLDRKDDGPKGYLALEASYSNTSGALTVSLDAQEDAGGIAVRLLSVPGAPSAKLSIQGSGPVDDFTADVALETDGAPRLSGKVALLGKADGQQDFSADLSGDLAPMFWPEYRAFLGNSLSLTLDGSSMKDGRLELSQFALISAALTAKGNLALAADGLPESFAMNLALVSPEGESLLLPLPTTVPTRVASARLSLGFDAAQSDAWTLGGLVVGLARADFNAQSLSLSGGGNITRLGAARGVTAKVDFLGTGMTPTDAALAQALGTAISGTLAANWRSGGDQTDVTKLSITGNNYAFTANGAVQGLASGFAFGGRIEGDWIDLSRLSGLTGLPLGGSATVALSGNASALGDAFDLRFRMAGEELRLGIPQADNLLSGTSVLAGQIARTEAGTTLRDIKVTAGELNGTLNGTLTSDAVNVTADLSLPDLGALGPQYRGSLSGAAAYFGTLQDGILSVDGKANGLGIGQVEVDRILAGPADLSVTIAVTGSSAKLQTARLNGQSVDLTATGTADGAIEVQAQLANLGLILPAFPGAVTVSGPLRQSDSGLSVDLALKGPAQVSGNLRGTIAPGYDRANLAFKGQSLADVANPFIKPRALSGQLRYDLVLSGPLSLSALNGRVGLTNGRLADPNLNFGLQNIDAQAEISGGQARISSSVQVTSGGSLAISGQTSLSFPFQGALDVDVQRVLLRQARLYETVVDGPLTVVGPLAGGAAVSGTLTLGKTELRIPSSGLSGSEPIPQISHVSEPADVRATRVRAGLTGDERQDGGSGGSGNYLLDITVKAPNQIFLRGRGLDAELGGSLRLRGTTASISPQGSFDLIRGRLDLVGRRLLLTQAQLMLEGEFVPRVDIVASIEDTDIISTIRISGPASDPVLSFESSPELPDEEVLAQLLFGERLQTLSAFQAAQLAVAVRTLAGKGGEGLVGKIRKGTGLDNLDIQTDEAGNVALTAGKYLSERVYSEVSVDQTGKTQIDLNFEVRPHITLKGKLDSGGDTGVGVYLEKNY